MNGGEDVLSLGYDELIAPMIKAIQEQQAMIAELRNGLTDSLALVETRLATLEG